VRAIQNLQAKEYVSAVWNINKSFKIYDSVYQSYMKDEKNQFHPDIVLNVKFGIGVFYYIISLIPYPSIQSILSVFGYKGDAEQGIKFMEEVYEGEGLKIGYSLILLLVSYLFLPNGIKTDPERMLKAEKIVNSAKERYP
jgi:hypothetical protein